MSEHEWTDDEVREFGRVHDFTDPASELNRLEALAVAIRLPACVWCSMRPQARPDEGASWVIEHVHADDCPDLDGDLLALDADLDSTAKQGGDGVE